MQTLDDENLGAADVVKRAHLVFAVLERSLFVSGKRKTQRFCNGLP